MVDQVLRGIAEGDFADVLFRAAAFARVVATGRAALPRPTATTARPGCWRWPSSSRAPAHVGTGDTGWRDAPRLGVTEYAGPRQPRVPTSAATSGHAP